MQGGSIIEGYSTAPGLIQAILKIVVGLGKLIFNARHRDPEIGSIPPVEPDSPPKEEDPQPKAFEREEQPLPAKEPESDWTHASVLFLIPERIDAGRVLGKAEELAGGIITRKLFDATDGKASIAWVFARTKPERYRAVSEALEARSGVFVLVARQSVGFVKALAVKRIENTLPEKLKNLPIEVIFERTQSELFVDIGVALKTSEPEKVPTESKPESTSIFSDPISQVKGLLLAVLTGQAAYFGGLAFSWWRRLKQKVQTN